MRESQKNRRTDETEGTGILWPEVSYDPEAPAGQNISFATEGRDADLSVRAVHHNARLTFKRRMRIIAMLLIVT